LESDSGYREKMDALDLIMNALKDHEKQLDEISHRLEQTIKKKKTGEPSNIKVVEETQKNEASPRKRSPLVIFSKWSEFKGTCQDSKMVAFEIEGNSFHVYALVDENVFTYQETLPRTALKVVEEQASFTIDKDALSHIDSLQFLIEGRLKCGLTLAIKSSRTLLTEREYLFELHYEFKPGEVKTFLSRELGVAKNKVVEGKINY